MDDIHFKRVGDDDFQAADPDSLMASVSRSDLGRTFAWSVAFHLAAIFLLSLGNIGLRHVDCWIFHYLMKELSTGEKSSAIQRKGSRRLKRKILLNGYATLTTSNTLSAITIGKCL